MDMENKRFEEAIGCLELEFHKNEDTLPLTEQQEEAYERMMKNMNFDAKVWVCFQMTSDFVESLFLNGENDLYGKFLSFNPPSIIQAESGKK
jgi:hypothetical protein